jgi:hypothetical protein
MMFVLLHPNLDAMNERCEVKVWHRHDRAPQLTLMVDACETVVRLTPEEADTLASQLMFQAQWVRHHTKRQRGQDSPVRHLREAGHPCPFYLERDSSFEIGAQLDVETYGMHLPACRYCWPHA